MLALTGPGSLGAVQGSCASGAAGARFDHVVLAVRDLAEASKAFRDGLGFSLKPGRVHANGLRNAHIRFADGSALELITTGPGEPDALSAAYDRFLEAGDGGAFVALAAGPADSVLSRLGPLADRAEVARGPAVEWVAFPEGDPLRAVFFVHIRSRPPDTEAQLRHRNGATGLDEVWLESPDPRALRDLLSRFGVMGCGQAPSPGGASGARYGLARGSLVVVPADRPEARGRVLTVAMAARSRSPSANAAGVRLEWRGPGR